MIKSHKFRNGIKSHRDKVDQAVTKANHVYNQAKFRQMVAAKEWWSCTSMQGQSLADYLIDYELDIEIQFVYYRWYQWPAAYRQRNTRAAVWYGRWGNKIKIYPLGWKSSVSSLAGIIAHECCHLTPDRSQTRDRGFNHAGNGKKAERKDSVPYVIGRWVKGF